MKCLQGASALAQSLKKFGQPHPRVFVVWEKVLATDWASPGSSVLARIPDASAMQFWDADRTVSHNLGETSFKTKVWDWVAIYPPGTQWRDRLPEPAYSGRPVEDAIGEFEQAMRKFQR